MESVIISQEPSRSPSEKREPNVDLPPLPYTNSPASVTGMAQDEKQMPQELPHQSDSGLPEYDDSGVAFTAYLPLAEVEHLPIRTRSPSPVPGSVKEEQKTAPIEQEPETSPAADGQDQDREIYEPRAAYDYVEDELDETDSPVYDAPPSSSSQSQSQSAEKAPPEAGEESWEDDNGEQRYEERFRLTPCVELEDEDDESGDERRKEIPVEVRIEGQVVAEVPSQQSQPEEAQQETRPETQTHPNALPGRQERELTPEEEAQWIAHWENNRVVCERVSSSSVAFLRPPLLTSPVPDVARNGAGSNPRSTAFKQGVARTWRAGRRRAVAVFEVDA
ncbi:hypothetical protein BDW22DRAFT_660568 [Trametopsis cervina]|nr:hypothetical protein BDW22DRAFT_660568 [Trametopsis cervina]